MKILYFAPSQFQDLKQRAQHIAEELSKEHEIWYIEPTISLLGSIKSKQFESCAKYYDLSPTLHVVRLNGVFSLPIRMQFLDPFGLNTWYERLQLKKLIPQTDIWWIGYEVWTRLLCHKQVPIVYDKMDDNILLNTNIQIKRFLKKMEDQLLSYSDLVLVTANTFLCNLSLKNSNVHLIPNGIEWPIQNMHEPYFGQLSQKKNGRKFLYVGKISHWFDLKAIEIIADANPLDEIWLLGPNEIEKSTRKNVIYHGTVPKKEVFNWISKCDVCLYTFKKNELLDTINPVKIYEYLAMNKAIIAVDSLEIRQFNSHIYTYKNYSELKEISQTNLTVPFSNKIEWQNFIRNNTWEQRAKEINYLLQQLEVS